jgi:hypothetical protein
MKADSNIRENFLRPVLIQLLSVVVFPVVALSMIDRLIIETIAGNSHFSTGFVIALVLIPKVLVLPWIGINILRFTEEHYKKFGIAIVKTSLLACLCCAVLAISVGTIDAIQAIISGQKVKHSDVRVHQRDYRLSADMASHEYFIEGTIDHGISNDFRLLLEQQPGGTRVVLASVGGSIYEGRGLAVLIRSHNLDTHVIDECSSACTLAFVAGQRRSLGGAAKLGFHQYVLDYTNRHQVSPFHDPLKEQERDSAFMLKRGISKEFVDRIFDKLHNEIWYPDHASLLRAGVVHAVTP